MSSPLAKRILRHASKQLAFDEGISHAKKISAYKEFMKSEMDLIKQRHREGGSGLEIVLARTVLVDSVIEALAKEAFEEIKKELPSADLAVSIIAIGGYGRSELCPLSDIDVMFLFPSKTNSKDLALAQEIIASKILYPLWDTGLKVGHSSRTVDEAFNEAKSDIQTKTALLESRLITGSEPLYEAFKTSYNIFYRKDNPKGYIDERLRDQRDRRAKFGGSVFMQEPDIKSGVGGLRDYHSTFWMARVRLNIDKIEGLAEQNYLRKSELKEFKAAYDFLLKTRNELHFRSKRPTDLLSLETQPKVALRLGYKERNLLKRVEFFMRDYYQHAQNIYQISKAVEARMALSNEQEKKANPLTSMKNFLLARRKERVKKVDGFILRGSEIAHENANVFKEDPVRLVRVFRHMQQHKLEADVELSTLIRASLKLIDEKVIHSPDANLSFRTILQETGSVYETLNAMHQLGVLGKFMPEWGKLTCLVQHEYYHRYTADVHTLHTIRELDNVFTSSDPVFERYRRELHEFRLPNLLYLILLLHDIGKAKAIKDHAESGVELAEPILDRFQIAEENRILVRFIIKHHLKMARFWQRYDIDDPETAKAFAEQVESPEKLRLLYVHTFCDARGTANGLWNAYKDTLHTTLFKRAMDAFRAEGKLEERYERHKQMTQRELLGREIEGIGSEEIDAHFQLLPDRYFINTSKDDIILHIRMINQLLQEITRAENVGALKPVIDWREDINRSFTVVNVITWDRPGLFHKLAGALNIAGFSILSAKGVSRDDHIAIDTFYVVEREGKNRNVEDATMIFEECVKDALIANADLYPVLQNIMQEAANDIFRKNDNPLAESFQSQVDVYREPTIRRTILEVQAPDHLGLLYQISKCTFEHGFDIDFARINTERGIAIDTLYLSNTNKAATEQDIKDRLDQLKESLSLTLAGKPEPTAQSVADN